MSYDTGIMSLHNPAYINNTISNCFGPLEFKDLSYLSKESRYHNRPKIFSMSAYTKYSIDKIPVGYTLSKSEQLIVVIKAEVELHLLLRSPTKRQRSQDPF